MGAVVSRQHDVAAQQGTEQLEPARVAGSTTYVHAIPKEEALLQRYSSVWIEVSVHGFRLLRPDTKLPLAVFPWGQVHSWSHGPQTFAFRHFDDITKTIQQINMGLRDVDTLLSAIQGVVSGILAQRKHHSINDQDISKLVSSIQAHSQSSSPAPSCVELMMQHIQDRFLLADQARMIVAAMPSLFDKMESAVFLHARLIDQSHFNRMLEELPDDADRDNVWHRITQAKKASQALQHQHKPPGSHAALVSCASSPLPSSDLAPTGSVTGESTDQNTSSHAKPGLSNPASARHTRTHSVTSPRPRSSRLAQAGGSGEAAGAGGSQAPGSPGPGPAGDQSCDSSIGEQEGDGDAHMTDNEATSDAASAASEKHASMQS